MSQACCAGVMPWAKSTHQHVSAMRNTVSVTSVGRVLTTLFIPLRYIVHRDAHQSHA